MFVVWPRTVDDDELERIVTSQRDLDVTYDERGASLGELPAGYAHARYAVELGDAPGTFEAAVGALRNWETHTGAGITVWPRDATVEQGTVIAQRIRMGPVTSVACCRVVEVVESTDRFGFAYGSLPMHPVRGEEAFVVTRDPATRSSRFEVTAFSNPSHLLLRLAPPISRAAQQRVTHRYLAAVDRYVKTHVR
ncbi:MAG TPA: DUF1990 domain-containing protein [Acidimicrobiales bacterium]|jgi:uncharacterized protein (UPF0548 family)